MPHLSYTSATNTSPVFITFNKPRIALVPNANSAEYLFTSSYCTHPKHSPKRPSVFFYCLVSFTTTIILPPLHVPSHPNHPALPFLHVPITFRTAHCIPFHPLHPAAHQTSLPPPNHSYHKPSPSINTCILHIYHAALLATHPHAPLTQSPRADSKRSVYHLIRDKPLLLRTRRRACQRITLCTIRPTRVASALRISLRRRGQASSHTLRQ